MAARAALCAAGLALSLYAVHVEREAARDPSYRAACDLAPAVSCTRVFGSRWGRGLGLVEPLLGRDSPLNVPNGALGVLFYLLQALLGAVGGRGASTALVATSAASVAASLWLGGVLLWGLGDLCLVCLSTYLINLLLLLINLRPAGGWRDPKQPEGPQKPAGDIRKPERDPQKPPEGPKKT
ncbi:vitamin K epoxide reductase complex subunit 1-like [Myiozetetes cayanensis]|uniref:vitamin K epoxide reductase complex subunit 1-like n=1 Tax=Myiozetetes cayanensis TaxID=478635 RepID=UPI00215F73B0|nr:vitamin K epoxide reductase complex subunit 1-like [Myiozetetes cayanensis]XP_050162134.1 vitamin K epoxide reductase complex subunit 1-like [Myiozetetes cayanensis]XP_050162136.1 vitamin K epoxide reductase complex subunit 1-like [Myiozetetes cayanensis]XP_050162137.1 vitamin K epoxide reductase complex subunit 1-like [Myiozetetes cayanensis]XP_050162138.1 vitamin K epoxide reductase complex subunit 1-like [Myiozetetes cayanensis]XP_050162139.1 vitamin K epoxide reductase complex subunit 1